MSTPDLNLLVTLDVLLAEGSVARAARRLAAQPLGDEPGAGAPARDDGRSAAGQGRTRSRAHAPGARTARAGRPAGAGRRGGAAPGGELDLKQLVRTFTLRTSDGFVENFGPGLIARVGAEAPGVRLRFVQKPDKDSAPLRDGTVDLETGVWRDDRAGSAGPGLFRDRFIGVVRMGIR
jgi:DNA-binding transcriptional LysR family regulator